jgi:hypothetical protein
VTHLLDTDHISFLQHGSGADFAVLTLRMSEHPPEAVGCGVVGSHEQVLGAHARLKTARDADGIVRAFNLMHKVTD